MNAGAKERFTSSSKEQWRATVSLCFSGADPETLARETSVNLAVLRQKFSAIRYARESGRAEQVIVEMGQNGTLKAYAAAKRNRHEPQKMLRWRVSRRLADAIQSSETSSDQEEALVTRLVRVAKLRTSEDFWLFMHSYFALVSDEEIAHHASIEPEKKGALAP